MNPQLAQKRSFKKNISKKDDLKIDSIKVPLIKEKLLKMRPLTCLFNRGNLSIYGIPFLSGIYSSVASPLYPKRCGRM